MKKILISFLLSVVFATGAFAETVVFNVQTYKIHKPDCQHAVKCTKNCIRVEKQKAKAKGGVPCKVCGG